MSEHQPRVESAPKPSANLERMAAERLKQIERHSPERTVSRNERVEAAREKLKSVERPRPQAETAPKAEPVPARGILTQAVNYRQTMVSLRHRMKPASRRFSEFIHAPVVESVSEVVGKTVLRPSVSAGATTTAVLLTSFVYFYARHYGFEMRGSEVWVALLMGGAIGLAAEIIFKSSRRLFHK